MARTEDIGNLALMDEDGRLSWADDQLGTPFDLVAVAREAPHQRMLAIVDPFDDIDQLGSQFLEECHYSYPIYG